MANHKSSEKDVITSRKAALRNRSYKSQVRTAIKRVSRDVEKKDLAKAEADLKLAVSIIDRTRAKHVQALNTTNRQKGRVYDMVNKLRAEVGAQEAAPAVEETPVAEETPTPVKKTRTKKAAAPAEETPASEETAPAKKTRTKKATKTEEPAA